MTPRRAAAILVEKFAQFLPPRAGSPQNQIYRQIPRIRKIALYG
jgi:hypothetical protein